MKTIYTAVALLSLGMVVLLGPWTVAKAGDKSDFALFDGTNPANTASGAVCHAKDLKKGKAFTYHVTVTAHSSGPSGVVRVTYFDGDFVEFPIASGGSFSFSQAAGSKGGADRAVRVSNGTSDARLVGAMSVIGTEDSPVCKSCDADSAGDGGCDAIVPD